MDANQEYNMIDTFEKSDGEFAERCFPKTYQAYIRKQLHKRPQNKDGYDHFDSFIMTRFSLFRYLGQSYYKCNKPSKLKFAEIAPQRVLDHLDYKMAQYLSSPTEELYEEIRQLYVFSLEAYISDLATG